MSSQQRWMACAMLFAVVLFGGAARADIFRWDTGAVIPGTEGIVPGPGVNLSGRELEFANFHFTNLTEANFALANLTDARFDLATLTNANLTGAVVAGADFGGTTSLGLSKEQLYSTASYQAKNLRGIGLGMFRFGTWGGSPNDLTGWDFRGQDLTGADLTSAIMNGTDLTGAVVTGARFNKIWTEVAAIITKEQLYSTASYQAKNLQRIELIGNDMTGWDFNGQDLTGADFAAAQLTNARLTGANLGGARMEDAKLTNADLSGATLTGANCFRANLTNSNLTNAILSGANLSKADTRGAIGLNLAGAMTTNLIRPDGVINDLNLVQENLIAFARVPIPVKFDSGFSITNGAQFDLTDSAAIVNYAATSPATKVRAHILSGRGTTGLGGTWTGPGITSSTAASAAPDSRSLGYADNSALPLGAYTTFHGAPVDSTSVLIAFTRTGDANLDGVVDDDDVTIVGATYAPGVPNPSWALGDFDYNGFVDDDDVTLLGAFYDPSAPPLNSPAAPGVGASVNSAVSAVPEPSTAALALLVLVLAAAVSAVARGGRLLILVAVAALSIATPTARADIFRWDNGQLIPGTKGITPGPSVGFYNLNLNFAGLSGVDLKDSSLYKCSLVDADLTSANLTNADLFGTALRNARLTGALVMSADLGQTTPGFTARQLYSTASYQARNLQGIFLGYNDLTDWDFSGQDLTNASLQYSTLKEADFTGALVTGTSFVGAPGFTRDQLYSTASYNAKNLEGIGLLQDLAGWDFRGQNLTNASFGGSTLTGADLTGAVVRGALFHYTTPGSFAPEQLYSTASYQARDLVGMTMNGNDLTGWDFSRQDLTNALFNDSTLTGADMTGAVVTGAQFNDTASRGFTRDQLYSTASYRTKDLHGISLSRNNLTGWNLSRQNLSNARLEAANVTGANMTGADARNAGLNVDFASAITANMIQDDGSIRGLQIRAGQELVVRDYDGGVIYDWPVPPIPITVLDAASIAPGGRLQLVFEADAWDSTISFASGILVELGGMLDLTFANDDVSNQVGRTLRIFDWTGVSPTHDFQVRVPTGTLWDVSKLYTAGEVTVRPLLDDITIPAGAVYVAGGLTARSLTLGGDGSRLTVATVGRSSGLVKASALSIVGGATIDLTDNAAIIDHAGTSPVATVREHILSGRGGTGLGGKWTGTGITSSTASEANKAQPDSRSLGYADNASLSLGPYTSFHGAAVDDTSVLIAYTRTGDANLDGVVNDDDVTIIGATYSPGVPQPSWALGDFDYNGFVDDDDVTLLGVSYDPSAPPLNSPAAPGGGAQAVPEPSTAVLTLLVLAVAVSLKGLTHRRRLIVLVTFTAVTSATASARADIYRWDTGAVIPGTEGIVPGPGVRLDNQTLEHAALSERNLANSNFFYSNLQTASFANSDLTNASLVGANLANSRFAYSDLDGAQFVAANLAGADFSGANVTEANFIGAGLVYEDGFAHLTKEQLYSTASYKAKDLYGISLGGTGAWFIFMSDLTSWDLSGQNLSRAHLGEATLTGANLAGANLWGSNLYASTLTNADLTGAVVTGANFGDTHLTKEQLYSTASYKAKDVTGIGLAGNDLTGWDFNGQTISRADLSRSMGFAASQLYSTASYKAKDLTGIGLASNDVIGWDLSGQNLNGANLREANLTNADLRGANLGDANLYASTLTNADLTGAYLTGADLADATLRNADLSGSIVTGVSFSNTHSANSQVITAEQLYSTASYRAKDLRAIELPQNDLTGWDFSGQNLTGANLGNARIANANLTGAIVKGVSFHGTGLTKKQLYSTASYRAKDLHKITLAGNDLTGWDLSGQDLTGASIWHSILTNANLSGANLTSTHLREATLTNANLSGANLTAAHFEDAALLNANLTGANLTGAQFYSAALANANLTAADARSATFLNVMGAITTNLIRPDGHINGLNLAAGEKLVAYAGVLIPVKFGADFSIAATATFDLTDNVAIVDHTVTSPAGTVRAQILSGRGGAGLGGKWNSTGITSSTAAAANAARADSRSLGYAENATLPLGPYTSFHGAPVDSTSVLIAYTRTGDANLDGVVNDDDVTIVGATYAPGVPQPSWALGDFDYNGFVDDDDVTLLGAFYDPSAAPLGVVAPPGAAGVAAVPEPTCALLVATTLLGLGIFPLIRRAKFRRRRSTSSARVLKNQNREF